MSIDPVFQQAVSQHQSGNLHEAENLYQVFLKTHPNHPEANHNLGLLALQMKQPAASLAYFMAALDADPTRGKYWINYIDALFQAGQLEDARQILALAQQHGLQGDDLDALAMRLKGVTNPAEQASTENPPSLKESLPISSAAGDNMPMTNQPEPDSLATINENKPSHQEIDSLVALFSGGRFTEAATLAQTMTQHFPLHEFGWKALGAVFKQMGRNEDALAPMQKAAALSPGDVEAHYNLGVTLYELGHLDDAEASYRRALQIEPNYGEAHSNLGVTLHKLGRLEEAEICYRRAIQIKPDFAEAHSNLGATLKDLGRLDEAKTCYMQAIQINPDSADAYSNLGSTLNELGRLDEAETSHLRALQIKPEFAEAHYNLGVTLKELGRLDETVSCYRRAIQIKPDFAEAHYNLGISLKESGLLDEAEACYQRAIQIRPDYAEAHSNLGVTFHELGRLDEAEAVYRRAIQINPDYAEAYSNLGNTLKQLGRLDEAEASYRGAIEIKPDYAQAYSNLGVTLQKLDRLDEAEACYRQALQLEPDYAEAHCNLGVTLQKQDKLDEAEACYRRALQIKPNYAEAYNNLGVFLHDLNRQAEAEASYKRALEIKPDYADAHSNLGNTLKQLGRFDEAEASYRRAIKIKPDYAEAYSNLGVTLQKLGRLEEAEACYRQALQIEPDYTEAHNNLGVFLYDLGRLVEAEASYRRALEIKPDYAEAHNNLGTILQELGRLGEAEASYRRALEIKSDYPNAHSNLLFLLNYTFSTLPSNNFLVACEYGQKVARKVSSRFAAWSCEMQPERLRIGFVSGDFKNHPVGYFLESLLALLDQNSVELIAYPTDHKTDELTARIKPHFSAWKPLYGLNDETAAHVIHNDKVHILIDLSGHTRSNRLPVFAWKPAPVQVTWLGYFATTGVKEIDYLIADPWTLPESEEAYFTEKIWRLPETRLCFTPPNIELNVSPLPALTNGFVTFGCFNNLTKMNDDVVALWSRVIASVPGSRLFLKAKQLQEASERQRTIERFAEHGIEANHLILEGHESREKYLPAYHRADIMLDPFPFPGGTTSVESLWMGVPVLTLAGKSFLSRQGIGIVMNTGLPEWIAADTDDYVARATSHAGDLQRLAKLRNGLRQQVLASPIMDARRFAIHFEAALRGMWKIWQKK